MFRQDVANFIAAAIAMTGSTFEELMEDPFEEEGTDRGEDSE